MSIVLKTDENKTTYDSSYNIGVSYLKRINLHEMSGSSETGETGSTIMSAVSKLKSTVPYGPAMTRAHGGNKNDGLTRQEETQVQNTWVIGGLISNTVKTKHRKKGIIFLKRKWRPKGAFLIARRGKIILDATSKKRRKYKRM